MSNPYGQNPYSEPGEPGQSGQNPYAGNQPGDSPYAQNPYGQTPATYGGQPYGQEHPQGTLILIFGILGLFVGIFAPVAWVMGSKATKEIKASGAQYTNEQQIKIGRILGMVFTLLYVLVIVISIIAFIGLFALSASTG